MQGHRPHQTNHMPETSVILLLPGLDSDDMKVVLEEGGLGGHNHLGGHTHQGGIDVDMDSHIEREL